MGDIMTALPIALAPIATDQRTVAERAWKAGTVAAKPQKPCDEGLFAPTGPQFEFKEMERK